jgi:hypothetical protein
MKVQRGIVGAAGLILGSCLAASGLVPSSALVGSPHPAVARIAGTSIHAPEVRADVSDLARANAAVASAVAERARQVKARAAALRSSYHETVWTSGFQAQINACRGAVNVTARYHVATIAEKWQCGGSRFPHAGALVRLSGVINGLYRVGPVVAVLNAYVDRSTNIPRGYPLLYQTCRYGNAHTETFTELIPVH